MGQIIGLRAGCWINLTTLFFFICYCTHVYLFRKFRKLVKYHAICSIKRITILLMENTTYRNIEKITDKARRNIEQKELETLITASIETLKQ